MHCLQWKTHAPTHESTPVLRRSRHYNTPQVTIYKCLLSEACDSLKVGGAAAMQPLCTAEESLLPLAKVLWRHAAAAANHDDH
jgi:hypothetical protein